MINTKKPQKIISTKNQKDYSNKDDIKFTIDLVKTKIHYKK